jgi:hypothetical protein
MKVRQQAVHAIGHRRAGRAPRLVARSEHEVIDQKLGATIEELGQRPRTRVGVEAVVLLNRHPRQLAALLSELVRLPGVLLLSSQQLLTRRLSFLTAADLVILHRVLPPSECMSRALNPFQHHDRDLASNLPLIVVERGLDRGHQLP